MRAKCLRIEIQFDRHPPYGPIVVPCADATDSSLANLTSAFWPGQRLSLDPVRNDLTTLPRCDAAMCGASAVSRKPIVRGPRRHVKPLAWPDMGPMTARVRGWRGWI